MIYFQVVCIVGIDILFHNVTTMNHVCALLYNVPRAVKPLQVQLQKQKFKEGRIAIFQSYTTNERTTDGKTDGCMHGCVLKWLNIIPRKLSLIAYKISGSIF